MGVETQITDVLIVGAGPVGMALACGLHQAGVDVLLIEKASRVVPAFKGEFIQPLGVEILKRVGLDPSQGSSSANRVRELRFRDLDRADQVISDLLMTYSSGASALSISHSDLLTSLRAQTRNLLGDEKFWCGVGAKPARSVDRAFFHAPTVLIEKPGKASVQVQAKYVIGCDGRGSTVRSWMNGPRAPANAPVVAGARNEWIVGGEIFTPSPLAHRYEVFRSYTQGTLSAFSLGEHGQRIYLSSLEPASNTGAHRRLQAEELLNRVQPHSALGALAPSAKVVSFPAYTQWFGPAQRGRVLLAGDACGITTPYGGQGITAGLESVENLLEWLPESVRSNDRKSSWIRERQYALHAKKTFYRHNLLNFGMYYIFFSRSPLFKLVTKHVVENWQRNPELAQRVMNLFGGSERDIPGVKELTELWGLPLWPGAWAKKLIPVKLISSEAR